MVNHKIQVELNSHAETSVVGSNVLDIPDHESYVDIYDYDSKSSHKNIITVDAAEVYDNPQRGEMSVLHINQDILIPSIKIFIIVPYAMS